VSYNFKFTSDPQNTQRASQCRCDECDLMLYHPSIPQRYCRKCRQWFNIECLDALELRTDHIPDSKLPARYDGIELEEDFLAILIMPICRGGPYGVVGNGWMYSRAKSLLGEVRAHGALPKGWRVNLPPTDSESSYYMCPCCSTALC
jgi:hypothetical protein